MNRQFSPGIFPENPDSTWLCPKNHSEATALCFQIYFYIPPLVPFWFTQQESVSVLTLWFLNSEMFLVPWEWLWVFEVKNRSSHPQWNRFLWHSTERILLFNISHKIFIASVVVFVCVVRLLNSDIRHFWMNCSDFLYSLNNLC